MKLKAIGCLAALLLVVGKIEANEQPAPCVVYFSVLENDVIPAHLSISKMNKAQSSWYEKHGDRDKYAGICYVENRAGAAADAPLYGIVWGQHLASEPYVFSYETAGQVDGEGTRTEEGPHDNANSATKKDYVADGWLAVWDPKASEGKGKFVSVAPLHNETRANLSSASTLLLIEAMEQISQREKEKLAVAANDRDPHKTGKDGNSREERNGWTEITITPINSGPPAGAETSSTTPQSSPGAAPSSVPATVPEYSPGQSSAPVPSTVAVSSTPTGADIFVDEDFVGNTPSTINVTAGRHVITVKKSGFQSWARVVNFTGGLITLNAELAGGANVLPAADPPATSDNTKEASIAEVSTNSPQKPGWIGVSAENGSGGALVTNVIAQSPAARAGIHVGDIILSLDGQLIKGKDFDTQVAGLKPGTRVPVDYTRGSSPHEVWITVGTQN